MKIWRKPECYYPPGYEYEKERKTAKWLYRIGVWMSPLFLGRLFDTVMMLYDKKADGKQKLVPGIRAESFVHLAAEYALLFAPLFLFLAGMAVYHYWYYYHDTKSIYLMRRLHKRSCLLKSCIQAPLLGTVIGAMTMLLLYFLYYRIYLLVIPAECMPRFL